MASFFVALILPMMFFCNCGNDESGKIKEVLKQAVSFNASSRTIREISALLENCPYDEKLIIAQEGFGTNNLSYFLLANNINTFTNFHIHATSSFAFIMKQRLPFGKSLVSFKDITSLNIVKKPYGFDGDFTFDAKGVIGGKCLFEMEYEGNTLIMKKLAIAHKTLPGIKNSFFVFGSL